jgi:hypothetical protein
MKVVSGDFLTVIRRDPIDHTDHSIGTIVQDNHNPTNRLNWALLNLYNILDHPLRQAIDVFGVRIANPNKQGTYLTGFGVLLLALAYLDRAELKPSNF